MSKTLTPGRAGLLALPVLALFLLSSCTVTLFPFLIESASQLATTAAANWNRAGAHRVRAIFDSSNLPVTADEVIATRTADASGSGTAGGKPFQYLEVDGKSYLKGQSFWQGYYAGDSDEQLLAKGFQDNWTLAGSNRVAEVLAGFSDLDHLVGLLSSEAKHLKKGRQQMYHGQPVTELTDGKGHVWWTTQGSQGQVVAATAPRSLGLGQAAAVTLLAATAPAPRNLASLLTKPVVDPNNPSTLPARYSAVSQHEPGSCNQNGCAIAVTVENMDGAPAGQGVVTVTAYKDSAQTQKITSCTADIPGSIPTNQSGTATCTLAGAAWAAFANASPAGGTFYVGIEVTANPPYV